MAYGFKCVIFSVFPQPQDLHLIPEDERPNEADIKGHYDDKRPSYFITDLKRKLKDSGVFDVHTAKLDDWQKDELQMLWENVEILVSSRARQPERVQSMFANLRAVESVFKKLHAGGQITNGLANQFKWDKLDAFIQRHEPGPSRVKALYRIDEKTKMRIFQNI